MRFISITVRVNDPIGILPLASAAKLNLHPAHLGWLALVKDASPTNALGSSRMSETCHTTAAAQQSALSGERSSSLGGGTFAGRDSARTIIRDYGLFAIASSSPSAVGGYGRGWESFSPG
jgi:hypothetical protein